MMSANAGVMSLGALFAQVSSGVIYLALYAVFALFAIFQRTGTYFDRLMVPLFVMLMLFVGLRIEVGGDWDIYVAMVGESGVQSFLSTLAMRDPAYQVLNWLGYNLGGGVYLPNFVCAVLSVGPLLLFCRTRTNPALSLTVALPYLLVVVYLGYTRQSAAIGLCLLAIMALEDDKVWKAALVVGAASLFHYTAAGFFVPIAIFGIYFWKSRGVLRTAALLLFCVVYPVFLLSGSVGLFGKIETYLSVAAPDAKIDTTDGPAADQFLDAADADQFLDAADKAENLGLQSAGAVPRLAISFIAAALFFLVTTLRGQIKKEEFIWSLFAVGSFILVPLALFVSTFADRIGLFLIPLQMHVVSLVDVRLPKSMIMNYRVIVVGLFFGTLFVWLALSSYARHWLPYDNLLFHLF